MRGIIGLVGMSRHQVPAGATRTVTTRDDVVVTLWIERGVVQLVGAGAGAADTSSGCRRLPLSRASLG